MREWREHCKKEYEQRELAKLHPKIQVMQNIQEHYVEEVERLFYKKYLQLALLLRKFHEEFEGCMSAEYYRMMDGKSSKFCNKLIKKWVEKIKSQLEAPILPPNSENIG